MKEQKQLLVVGKNWNNLRNQLQTKARETAGSGFIVIEASKIKFLTTILSGMEWVVVKVKFSQI